MNYARQHLYASLDMALASESPRPAIEVWSELEGATPMGHVPGTAFPATFGHIAADYAAGYYGYMWSEVLALDMLSAFEKDIMNPETGRRFRRTILERGGEVPARKLVEEFLGRPVSSEAFFEEITGRR
jgi:thimet oligopeptidase